MSRLNRLRPPSGRPHRTGAQDDAAPSRWSTHAKVGLLAALALVLLVVAAVVVVLTRDDDPVPLAAGEVRPGRDTVVKSADGRVVVEIPGEAVTEPGTLSIEPVADTEGHKGWAIELAGTELVAEATIRFAVPELEEDEPTPLVTSSQGPGAARQIVADVTMKGTDVVVHTDHFSNWFLDRWADLLSSTARWVGKGLDEAASITPDRAPRCEGERKVRNDGYEVTSDSGRRIYWCLGLVDGTPTLKAVNARGYGVVTEYTPGLRVTERDRGGLIDWVAKTLTPPPNRRVNSTELLASGNKIELAVSATEPVAGVRFSPNPGAYLLSALQFGVSTYTMLMDKLEVSGTTKKLLTALEGEQCLATISDLATTDLATPQQAQEFFANALGLAFDCVAIAAEEIDLGFINEKLVGPVVWLLSGLKTLADGIVAVSDMRGGFDTSGYQVRISHEVAPEITEASVGELLIPAGTCGDGTTLSWDQVDPIQLSGGQGESFDSDLVGAGVLDTHLVGAVDVTGDGLDEAVVALNCTGSLNETCCAGRTSHLDVVAVLDLSGDTPRRVGDTIMPIDVPGPNEYDETRSFEGDDVTLDGTTVVTYQTLVYPEQLSPNDVERLAGEVRYSLQGESWVPST